MSVCCLLLLACFVLLLLLLKLYTVVTCGRYEPKGIDLSGKTAVVTGASSGIGKQTALALAKCGARVYLACRNKQKAEPVAEQIRRAANNSQVFVLELDLSRLDSVRQFAEKFLASEPRLDILVNNAGIGVTGNNFRTADDLHVVMATNHFGQFLLTNLLLDRLRICAPSRIVSVSSEYHRYAHNFYAANFNLEIDASAAYANSKLANILHTRYLAQLLHGSGVTANCCHPGLVRTGMFRNVKIHMKVLIHFFLFLFGKSSAEGAMTQVFLAVSPDVQHVSGHYFADCAPKATILTAYDLQLAKQLWHASEKFTAAR